MAVWQSRGKYPQSAAKLLPTPTLRKTLKYTTDHDERSTKTKIKSVLENRNITFVNSLNRASTEGEKIIIILNWVSLVLNWKVSIEHALFVALVFRSLGKSIRKSFPLLCLMQVYTIRKLCRCAWLLKSLASNRQETFLSSQHQWQSAVQSASQSNAAAESDLNPSLIDQRKHVKLLNPDKECDWNVKTQVM